MENCTHSHQTPKKFTKTNGSVVVKFQCDDCGAGLLESPKSQHDLTKLLPFDHEFKKSCEDRQYEEARRKFKEQRELNRQEWFTSYSVYLRSPEWQRVRSVVLKRDLVCQVCFVRIPDQAHHLSYESYKRFGITFPQECVGVCQTCHDVLHGKEGA